LIIGVGGPICIEYEYAVRFYEDSEMEEVDEDGGGAD
jgi:hypothetical protein